jgi:long-chain acyl-CoA synthetase
VVHLGRGTLTTITILPLIVYHFNVLHQIKVGLGLDRVKFVVTGSAPISAPVHTFFRVLLGCNVYEGYGQTEGCAAAAITASSDLSAGHVGPPVHRLELE